MTPDPARAALRAALAAATHGTVEEHRNLARGISYGRAVGTEWKPIAKFWTRADADLWLLVRAGLPALLDALDEAEIRAHAAAEERETNKQFWREAKAEVRALAAERDTLRAEVKRLRHALERHDCAEGIRSARVVWCPAHDSYHCPTIDAALEATEPTTPSPG